MHRAATQPLDVPQAPYLGQARVLEVEEEGERIHVLVGGSTPDATGSEGPRKCWARPALPCGWDLALGDSVLVAGSLGEELYVVGVLGARSSRGARGRELVMDGGARAEVLGPPGAQRLQVFSAAGEMIFEHDPATGRSRVGVPVGDLEIVTPEGNIDFIAARGVRFFSREAIQLKSLQGIEMAVADPHSDELSSLDLRPGKIGLRGSALAVSAQRGELRIDEAEVAGRTLSGTIAQVKLTMERCETAAGTVIEKARNVYRTVAELTQLRTARMRTLVDQLYLLRSETALLRAEEDFKVDGEKIHLG